jgi:hypothetical protein
LKAEKLPKAENSSKSGKLVGLLWWNAKQFQNFKRQPTQKTTSMEDDLKNENCQSFAKLTLQNL